MFVQKKRWYVALFLLIFIHGSSLAQLVAEPRGFGVDFDQSMQVSSHYAPWLAQTNPWWQRVKNLYEQYIVHDEQYSTNPRIPKIVHHIWLGSPFPSLYEKFRKSWLDHNPDWTFVFWTDNSVNYNKGTVVTVDQLKQILATQDVRGRTFVVDLNYHKLYNQVCYSISNNYGERSDIVRYEALYELGGLYVDTDFECLQPFDYFHHCLDFYASVAYTPFSEIFVALIGSAPKHPVIENIVKSLPASYFAYSDTLSRTGNYHFTRAFSAVGLYGFERVVLFPLTYFYPWPNSSRYENVEKVREWIKPESCAIHYWEVSWSKPSAVVR